MQQSGLTMTAVSELEERLRILPPGLQSSSANSVNNPTAIAHAALEALRDSGDERFLFLRSCLEITATTAAAAATGGVGGGGGCHQIAPDRQELFFHCVSGVRQVTLQRWKHYSRPFLQTVRDYFMVTGHLLIRESSTGNSSGNSGNRMCGTACYTTAVSFWKRGWVDLWSDPEELSQKNNITSQHHHHHQQQQQQPPSPEEQALIQGMQSSLQMPALNNRKDLLLYLESIFSDSNQVLPAATFLNCLLSEFGGKSAVTYRMPLEFHKQAHRSFEKGSAALFYALKLSMNALGALIINNDDNSSSSSSSSSDQSLYDSYYKTKTVSAVIQLTIDVLTWEFGVAAWDVGSIGAAAATTQTLLKPPVEWKDWLARTDFLRAVFHLHSNIAGQQPNRQLLELSHHVRQLLIVLASLSGPMFVDPLTKKEYAQCLLDGAFQLWQQQQQLASVCSNESNHEILLDGLQLVTRIVANFKLAVLVEIMPALQPLLLGVTQVGQRLLLDHTQECQNCSGDVQAMENGEWREQAIALLLDCATLLCGDPWLLYSGSEESRRSALKSLSDVMGRPLYEAFVQARCTMGGLEERYIMVSASLIDADDDEEVREEIAAVNLEEEMAAVSALGRLDINAAIACLSTHFGRIVPQLKTVWEQPNCTVVTPDTAALLEEARILTMLVCYLLTDDCTGETPAIPDAIIVDRGEQQEHAQSTCQHIVAAVQAVLQFADAEVQQIAKYPNNPALSPLLAKTFLSFLYRWAPAYIYPADYHSNRNGSNASTTALSANPILLEWSTPEKSQQILTFCISLCLYYQCYWPHERQVQESVGQLLFALAKRGSQIRQPLVASPTFVQLAHFHCWTARLRHGISHQEFEAAVAPKIAFAAGESSSPNTNMLNMVWGYHRLRYDDKSRVLTALLMICSDSQNPAAVAMFQDCLKSLHEAFTALQQSLLSSNAVSNKIQGLQSKEMACLCVEFFCGVVHASEMSEPNRIPEFITQHLAALASLMKYFSDDLTVSETLLRFFRDYTERFVSMLDRQQCVALFHAAAELLKAYSEKHICTRHIVIPSKSDAEAEYEEEQAYSDILCAIQLLINLGTKDFIDACNISFDTSPQSDQLSPLLQVTDMIFFGLQQILPLMTQGLLQYPTLCLQFFDLVGFMMDTYPEKVCCLPYELFDALLEALLFGMSHHDVRVAQACLQAIGSLSRQHLEHPAVLQPHLQQHPDIFIKCARRMLQEVVFTRVVQDRVEATGAALLPLAAIDVNLFASTVVQGLATFDEQQRMRLQSAFTILIKPEILAKASAGGYEGRRNRVVFKQNFADFVQEIHSFLIHK